jgi:hypothetical protein
MEKGEIVLPRDDFFHMHDGLAAVVNGKYTKELYFDSGCTKATLFYIVLFLSLSPALTALLLPLVFSHCFLLARRAAQE